MREVVRSPDGRVWTVRRRWVPRLGTETLWGRFHRRFRQTARRTSDVAEHGDGCGLDIGEGIFVAVLVILVVVACIYVVIPLLVALVEVLLVVLLAALGVLARVVFRRPWTVEARVDGDDELRRWRVVGWRASGRKIAEIEQGVRMGVVPAVEVAGDPPETLA